MAVSQNDIKNLVPLLVCELLDQLLQRGVEGGDGVHLHVVPVPRDQDPAPWVLSPQSAQGGHQELGQLVPASGPGGAVEGAADETGHFSRWILGLHQGKAGF